MLVTFWSGGNNSKSSGQNLATVTSTVKDYEIFRWSVSLSDFPFTHIDLLFHYLKEKKGE